MSMRRIVRVQPDGTYRLDLKFFRHHREAVPYTWDKGSPEVGTLFTPALEELLRPRPQVGRAAGAAPQGHRPQRAGHV